VLTHAAELLDAPEHRARARQAVRESPVLLKNNKGLRPLSPKSLVLVACLPASAACPTMPGQALAFGYFPRTSPDCFVASSQACPYDQTR